MKKIVSAWIILAVILVLLIGSGVSGYNRLVVLSESVTNQWAEVDNQLQRRYDLIPNLVETVKGYAAHEKGIFEEVANARSRLIGARTVDERVTAAQGMETALARLLAIAENYPQLKADTHFTKLMDELSGTENRLAVARMRYNDIVKQYNQTIKQFPTVILARLFGFGDKSYFQIDEKARQTPQVKFGG
ncbi:MAG: LemA family protein [Firmicutes bacterium]|nr:LemA family protein [Bacillota bacterium]MCL5039293.1 LemA family protein [Bacillota bacterium]